MKNKVTTFLLPFFMALGLTFAHAQTDTATIGKGQFAISGNTYSFFQTVESVIWNRSIYLYPRQILQRVKAPITAFQLYRDVTRVTTVTPVQGKLLGNCRARVWFANVTQTDWTDIKTWTQAQVLNPTLVFNGDIKSIVDSTTGWKQFALIAPFQRDTNKNLAIFTEYTQDTAAIPQIFWAYDSTNVSQFDTVSTNYYSALQFRYAHKPASRTDLPVDTFTGSNIRHPQIKFLTRRVPNATNELAFVQKTRLFPNPAKAEITLQFESSEINIIHLCITDMTGKILFQQNLNTIVGQQQTTIPIGQLPAARYQIVLQTADYKPIAMSFVKIE